MIPIFGGPDVVGNFHLSFRQLNHRTSANFLAFHTSHTGLLDALLL